MEQAGRQAIIDGILIEAREKAAHLVETAERQAKERRTAWEIQEKKTLKEAEKEADVRAGEVARAVESRRKIEERRSRLQAREELCNRLTDEVRSCLAERLGDSDYEELLFRWIVEAALGLRLQEARIFTSRQEIPLITPAMLNRVEDEIKRISGREMKLVLEGSPPQAAQGVRLESMDGSVAFSNQVPVRIERYQSEIRRIIYDTLFKEDES